MVFFSKIVNWVVRTEPAGTPSIGSTSLTLERKHTGRVLNDNTLACSSLRRVVFVRDPVTSQPFFQPEVARRTSRLRLQTLVLHPRRRTNSGCRICNQFTPTILPRTLLVRHWNRSHTRGISIPLVAKLSSTKWPSLGSSWSSPCSRTRNGRSVG